MLNFIKKHKKEESYLTINFTQTASQNREDKNEKETDSDNDIKNNEQNNKINNEKNNKNKKFTRNVIKWPMNTMKTQTKNYYITDNMKKCQIMENKQKNANLQWNSSNNNNNKRKKPNNYQKVR